MSENLKSFDVGLNREVSENITIQVEAVSVNEAREKAIQLADSDDTLAWNRYDCTELSVDFVRKGEVVFGKGGAHLSNDEFVSELMNFSNYGALAQIFIIDAISKLTNAVLNASAGELAGMDNCLISGEAWQGVAREINDKLKKRGA